MTNEKDREYPITFHVIDNNTGEEADTEEIARTEEWAKLLMSMDMEGFALEEDGTLMLVDECGQFAYCPEGRFTVRFNGTPEQIKKHDDAVRAEAVKAEREKIAILEARIAELTKPYKPNYPDSKAYISEGPGLDSFLSDDQEDHDAPHS